MCGRAARVMCVRTPASHQPSIYASLLLARGDLARHCRMQPTMYLCSSVSVFLEICWLGGASSLHVKGQWHCSVEDVNMMCVHVLTSWAMQAKQEDKRRCRSDVRGGCGCAVMNELPRRAHPSELRDRETMRGGAFCCLFGNNG